MTVPDGRRPYGLLHRVLANNAEVADAIVHVGGDVVVSDQHEVDRKVGARVQQAVLAEVEVHARLGEEGEGAVCEASTLLDTDAESFALFHHLLRLGLAGRSSIRR